MSKPYAFAFYQSRAWKDCRVAYIKSVGGLCEDCLARGIYTPAKVVHHIKHITPDNINDPNITLSFKNLRAVCQDCHADEHKTRATDRYSFDAEGNITPPL